MPRPRERILFTWRDLNCSVDHVPNWKISGWSRLIIRVLSPVGAPLPVADSGIHNLDTDEDDIIAAGGVVAYIICTFNREAATRRYALAVSRWRQGNLFD